MQLPPDCTFALQKLLIDIRKPSSYTHSAQNYRNINSCSSVAGRYHGNNMIDPFSHVDVCSMRHVMLLPLLTVLLNYSSSLVKKDGMWNVCANRPLSQGHEGTTTGSETCSECLALKWLPQMTNHTNTSTDQSELNALMFVDTPKLAKNCLYKGNV